MKINDLLANYPNFSLATRDNNKEILQFIKTKSLKTPFIDIQYDRGDDFFSFLEQSSPNYFVFIARDKSNDLGLVGTLIIREGRINNKLTPIGYLGDLRLGPKLDILVAWKNVISLFLKNLEDIEEFNGLKYIITAVMDNNNQAMNSLVNRKKNKFAYRKLIDYRMVNVLIKLPFLKGSGRSSIMFAKKQDLSELTLFLENQNQKRAFGFCYEKESNELTRRFTSWNDFTIENYIIVRDSNNHIIACTAPYNPTPDKSIHIKSISRLTNLLLAPIRIFKQLPRENTDLKISYLTSLEVSNSLEDKQQHVVFNDLLIWCWEQGIFKNEHMISFCDFGHSLQKGLRGFIYGSEDMSLYQVYHKEKAQLLQNIGELPPGFEMALV